MTYTAEKAAGVDEKSHFTTLVVKPAVAKEDK